MINKMKFLTKKGIYGDNYLRVYKDYTNYIRNNIKNECILKIVNEYNLHDGKILAIDRLDLLTTIITVSCRNMDDGDVILKLEAKDLNHNSIEFCDIIQNPDSSNSDIIAMEFLFEKRRLNTNILFGDFKVRNLSFTDIKFYNS